MRGRPDGERADGASWGEGGSGGDGGGGRVDWLRDRDRRGGDDLIQGEVDLELDVLADKPATGLEGDGPGQADLLAVEPGRRVEAHPSSLESLVHAEVLDVERDRAGDVPD